MIIVVGRSSRFPLGDLSARHAFGALAALAVALAGATARGAPAGAAPATGEQGAPEVAPISPEYEGQDRPTYDIPEPSRRPVRRLGIHAWIGAQTLFGNDAFMPGLDLRVGQRPLWFELEGSLIWREAPHEPRFVGNHFAASIMVAPMRIRWFELRAGAGGDFFSLWNASTPVSERAFSVRSSAHVRLWPRVELFGGARALVARAGGGSARDDSVPVLFTLGLALRTE